MSDLQTALLTIGLGVIVAVYFFGWWQQRKYRRKFGSTFKADHPDALYQQPHVEHQPIEAIETVTEQIEEIPSVETACETPAAHIATPPLADGHCALLDAKSDFIIELQLLEPSPAAVLGGLWQRKFDFGKPVHVCGMKTNSPHWERAIAEGQTLYSRFRVALQMVDRSGAVSAAKLADFRDLVLGVARHIKAGAAVPEIKEIHYRAVELDSFCAEVDQMVGINLVPPGERLLMGAKIAQAAASHGMKLEADGAFHLPDAHGHSVLSLINQDTKPFQHHTLETFSTPGVTLLLDVPRVEHPSAQFDRMVSIARELARDLQVNMVDDHRVVLSESGFSRIHGQIAGVEKKMCAYGIEPGGAQARRLFS